MFFLFCISLLTFFNEKYVPSIAKQTHILFIYLYLLIIIKMEISWCDDYQARWQVFFNEALKMVERNDGNETIAVWILLT